MRRRVAITLVVIVGVVVSVIRLIGYYLIISNFYLFTLIYRFVVAELGIVCCRMSISIDRYVKRSLQAGSVQNICRFVN